MKKLLALSMAIVMVVSFSVISIAQNRPEITPVQNQSGELTQNQSQDQNSEESGDPIQDQNRDQNSEASGDPNQEQSRDQNSEGSEDPNQEQNREQNSETESDISEQSAPEPERTQRIQEIMAGLSLGAAQRIAERTMAIEENKEKFEEKKQEIFQKHEEMIQKRQEFANKREEYANFRNQLKERKDQAIENMRANNMLRAENNKLRGELQDSLAALSEAGTELSEGTLATLAAHTEQIRLLTEDLKSTKGTIGDAVSQTGIQRKDRDYEAMALTFEELYEIQSFRNECMNEINQALRSMLQLLASEA